MEINREIKFRGKRDDTNEWHYWEVLMGHKLKYNSVVLETIGQYTGLKDKNGKEIYEGDIIKATNFCYVVYFDKATFKVKFNANWEDDLQHLRLDEIFEVVGNIHENSNLLKCENLMIDRNNR